MATNNCSALPTCEAVLPSAGYPAPFRGHSLASSDLPAPGLISIPTVRHDQLNPRKGARSQPYITEWAVKSRAPLSLRQQTTIRHPDLSLNPDLEQQLFPVPAADNTLCRRVRPGQASPCLNPCPMPDRAHSSLDSGPSTS